MGATTQRRGLRPRTGTTPATRRLRPEEIAERLRAFRLAAGLSQAELAKRIGAHQPNLVRWEKGQVEPAASVYLHIEAVCRAHALVPTFPELLAKRPRRGTPVERSTRKARKARHR